jgi:hypothetical protein
MKNRPVHENLDTSFVNLSALVKYLRRRQFAGQVRIELSGYEADIYLTAENQLKVREYDHIAGRVAEGEEALRRILIRAREPGGIINVYQSVSEAEAAAENRAAPPPVEKPETAPLEKTETPIEKPKIALEKPPLAAAPPPVDVKPPPAPVNGANGGSKPKIAAPVNGSGARVENQLAKIEEKPAAAPKSVFPNVPFEFTNKVEARAKQLALSAKDREMLLELTGELLGTIDRALAMAKLEFPSAFQKACFEISADYPFLKTLDYGKGKIYYADAHVNPKFFVDGVLEAVRRILDKLAANDKFAEVYRHTVQRLLALTHQRRSFYDKFAITKPLEKILGA